MFCAWANTQAVINSLFYSSPSLVTMPECSIFYWTLSPIADIADSHTYFKSNPSTFYENWELLLIPYFVNFSTGSSSKSGNCLSSKPSSAPASRMTQSTHQLFLAFSSFSVLTLTFPLLRHLLGFTTIQTQVTITQHLTVTTLIHLESALNQKSPVIRKAQQPTKQFVHHNDILTQK